MFRYLAEPRNILAEPLGSAEPRLKNTGLLYWEMVRTTKITTSKTKKNSKNSVDDQNIKKIY